MGLSYASLLHAKVTVVPKVLYGQSPKGGREEGGGGKRGKEGQMREERRAEGLQETETSLVLLEDFPALTDPRE